MGELIALMLVLLFLCVGLAEKYVLPWPVGVLFFLVMVLIYNGGMAILRGATAWHRRDKAERARRT